MTESKPFGSSWVYFSVSLQVCSVCYLKQVVSLLPWPVLSAYTCVNIPLLTPPPDAGVPVYLYEFQQAPSILQEMRPSFVKADHGDDVMFVFGHCFTDGNITMESTVKGKKTDLVLECRYHSLTWNLCDSLEASRQIILQPHWIPYHASLLLDLCTEEEEQMERTVMAYWANFARTG